MKAKTLDSIWHFCATSHTSGCGPFVWRLTASFPLALAPMLIPQSRGKHLGLHVGGWNFTRKLCSSFMRVMCVNVAPSVPQFSPVYLLIYSL